MDYLEKLAIKLNCFRVRHILPKGASKFLMKWIKEHRHHPYPTNTEKEMMCKETGLSKKQVIILLYIYIYINILLLL
ncbi:hypothetical protein BCR36DRAFT_275613 [Piromyces finnis]|uniref:KN homeodomain domain-containing protein n=1 Tax=Piromyces finnis TaxID=1754191 RepID=A0A1Y1VKZ8_9FUNG|nr:hypothetical protein BCR36DRAFT_275613 [Piromyces finnis]|eukprot:ORX59102.1 hypothetical protein BCR36DRAFT_275613 [Piromyces finnis]